MGQIALAKTVLDFRCTSWEKIEPPEWTWKIKEAVNKFYVAPNADNGLELASVVICGLLQYNEVLNGKKLIDQVVDSLVDNLSQKTFNRDTVRGIVVSTESVVMSSIPSGQIPQLPLVAMAGAGLIAYINKWE